MKNEKWNEKKKKKKIVLGQIVIYTNFEGGEFTPNLKTVDFTQSIWYLAGHLHGAGWKSRHLNYQNRKILPKNFCCDSESRLDNECRLYTNRVGLCAHYLCWAGVNSRIIEKKKKRKEKKKKREKKKIKSKPRPSGKTCPSKVDKSSSRKA